MNSIVNILGASKIFIPLFQGTVALHRRVNELAVIAKLLFVCLFVCLFVSFEAKWTFNLHNVISGHH